MPWAEMPQTVKVLGVWKPVEGKLPCKKYPCKSSLQKHVRAGEMAQWVSSKPVRAMGMNLVSKKREWGGGSNKGKEKEPGKMPEQDKRLLCKLPDLNSDHPHP